MGGLGVLASHCIVQAQLIVPVGGKVKHYGPHLFIMRSETPFALGITRNTDADDLNSSRRDKSSAIAWYRHWRYWTESTRCHGWLGQRL